MQPAYPPPMIAIDGREGDEGRALLAVSALYHCADTLLDCPILFVDVESAAVEIAVEVLRWDTGLQVTTSPPQARVSMERMRLLAAIVRQGLPWPRLQAVRHAGLATLIAVQFPPPFPDGETLGLLPAAHDPCRFAERLAAALGKGGRA
jgi:hypothetical protein